MTPVSSYNEQDLLLRVANGEQTAFREIFREWYPRLLAYVLKVTGSRETSEEIVQDVFTKIWVRRVELTSVINFQSYLFVAARHHALNELEKLAVYWKVLAALTLQASGTSRNPDVDLRKEWLDNAIAQLSPRQREIWLLHRREQYSYDEIARQLGISKETVKTHLQIATGSITAYLKGKETLLILLALSTS